MTEPRRQPTLRTLVILLALLDLALLGMRLWPWQDVMALPGNGATGIDPAITLDGYTGLAFWIGNARKQPSRKSLFSAAWLGRSVRGVPGGASRGGPAGDRRGFAGGLDKLRIALLAVPP